MAYGRPYRFKFLIERLEDEKCFAPATIAALLTEEDLKAFNEEHCEQITMEKLKLRARTALASFRRRHITIPFTGFAKVSSTSTDLFAWYGKVWKSAFGLLEDNTLHIETPQCIES